MKKRQKKINTTIAVLFIVALLVYSCWFKTDSVNFPKEVTAGTNLEGTIEISMENGTSINTHFVFGILVPREWDVENTATITLTTKGVAAYKAGPDLTDAKLIPVGSSETDPASGKVWEEAFNDKYPN